jgi:hypothetical protein
LISLALVGVPAYLLTGDPVATFNAVVLLKVLLGALAMWLLIFDWTRSSAAGVVAGLLYAFHATQIERPYHLLTSDNAWMLLGLFFARRLFARGRWVDAVGVGAASVLQMSSSFYPFFSSALTALPLLVWLFWHYGWRKLAASRAVLAAAIVGVGAALVFGPYLGQGEELLRPRRMTFYAPWSAFLPGGEHFPGWSGAVLIVAAFALGRRRALAGIGGDPRTALVIAALLVASFATGGNHRAQVGVLTGGEPPLFALPNPFRALAELLPGLENVRGPAEFAFGVRAIACILAGLGAAATLRRLPRPWAPACALALIGVVFAETLWPAAPGGPTAARFGALRMRPDEGTIRFFEALERAGNRGPLLELPIPQKSRAYTFLEAPAQHLLSAYHHRRTSGCYVSLIPPQVRDLASLSAGLPGPAALEQARSLGFTTVIVHHRAGYRGPNRRLGAVIERRLQDAAARGDSGIERVATSRDLSAYTWAGDER